jgi:CMP/dCMP kinase
MPLQIAIDGPAASGKTTVARMVAQRLGILYLDTGAMYRALAYVALQMKTDVDNGPALARLYEKHPLHVTLDESSPLGFRIRALGRELGDDVLHSPEVTAVVSTVAAHAEVRDMLVPAQRELAAQGSVVMAGRDIGTVVLPHAQVKIYLDASVAARVERRRAQIEAAGGRIDAELLAQELAERDALDRTRAVSPLEPAAGAHIIDSSAMTAAQVVDEVCAIAQRAARGGA